MVGWGVGVGVGGGTGRRDNACASETRGKHSQVYWDDASRLCDLAREAVAFGSAGGLARFLEAVRADPEACAARVRDRGLLGGGGAEASGGFRCGREAERESE